MSGLSRDDITRMAREAGISKPWDQEPVRWETLERFATLVAAAEREKLIFNGERLLKSIGFQLEVDKFVKAIEAEREACAALCDAHKNPIDDPTAPVGQYESGGYIMAEFLADAIRARGSDAT